MARWAKPDPSNMNQRRKWNLEGNLIFETVEKKITNKHFTNLLGFVHLM